MSGNILRFTFYLVCMLSLASCGGGGGSKPSTSSSAAPLDTDRDGRPDAQDAFPTNAAEWLDTDKDGVGDNGDAFPNDVSETLDTDKDGVGNNGDAFPNDASETLDSDKDGIGNNKDTFPNDATESVDTDKDGVGDNSDTSPLGQAIPAWSTYQGDAKHSGAIDITLTTTNFKQRWSKPMEVASSQPGVAGDGFVFFNNAGALYALNAHTGQTLWTRLIANSNESFYSYQQPAYADGIVYIQTGGDGNRLLWAFNAADGSLVFQSPVNLQSNHFMTPVVHDGTVYIAGDYYLVYAIDAKTGALKWTQMLNQSDQFTPAVAGDNVITYGGNYSPELSVVDRNNGNLKFDIADTGFSGYGWGMSVAPVVAGDYVLAQHAGRLVAFSLSRKQVEWEVTTNFVGQPVVKGDYFYIVNQGAFETRLLSSGVLVSSVKGNVGNSGASGFIGQLLTTNNLLFVRDQENTYAYELDTGARVWTLVGKSGGMLMAEGALVIFTSTGVVTVDLEGDIDSDGLPDWWEKRFKKNIDPVIDTDNDGLTAQEEFNLHTNPVVADTDGDGLLDGEEAIGTSFPLKADTDGDGLSDYAEVKTHLTDPAKADTDGDTLDDAEEIAAGLNPVDTNDALADLDNDGFSNLHEVRANTLINDANSLPRPSDWSGQQGNSGRNSYSPLLLNDSQFSERWSKHSYQSFNSPVTVGNNLILRTTNQLLALDFATGASNWAIQSANSVSRVSTDAGKIVYFNTNGGYPTFVVADAATGANLLNKTLGSFLQYDEPLVSGDKLFHIDSNNRLFKAYSLTTGNLLWTTPDSGNYIGNWGNLVRNDRLIGLGSSAMYLFSTTNGSLLKTISYSGNGVSNAMAGARDNVIVIDQSRKVASVSTTDGALLWMNQECAADKTALGNGNVYAMSSTKLCVIDEETGVLSWSLPLTGSWYRSNLVLTASHLFYSDGYFTYGVNLALKSVTWRIEKPATQLALGSDGTLYLQMDGTVIAIDTEGDTDTDGMPQWWERLYGGDLVATADLDSDGLTNLQELTRKTNPLVADTDGDTLLDGEEVNTTKTDPLLVDSDKDGLSDGEEVRTHGTDPLLADSDGDGIDDARELAFALDPLNEEDAAEDNDSDGISNRDEIYSGTDCNLSSSKPVASDWAMKQANAAHNGFQPYRFDEDNFSLRWSKTFSSPIQPVVTGDNHVFAGSASYNDINNLFSLNVVDGKQQWEQNVGQSYYGSTLATYDSGQKVLIQSSNPPALRRFSADQGTPATSISLSGWSYENQAASIFGNNAYTMMGSGGIVATNLDNGANLWSATVSISGADIALNNQYLFYTYNTQIVALDRVTGSHAFSIDTQSPNNTALVLGTRNNIITFKNGLVSFDINSRKQNWHIPSNYGSGILPVAANGQVYYLEDGALISVDEIDGSLRWSWRPNDEYINSNIIATLSHIFVATNNKTYALSAATGEVLWNYDTGGNLALGADGALYIQSNQQLIAINLEGDTDSDGLPDWWERYYGLDLEDADDAALDLDSDGLTNLEEFTHKTYADNVDSDGDSLNDAYEVNIHHTDPVSTDSDKDGMRDDWELDNSLDPIDAADRDTDSDSDSVPNYFEYLVGTDPNDVASLPSMFSAGVYSFEDGNLPTSWILSSDTTDVSISLNNASHGTKALQMRNKAEISFVGFFAASDLALDVKSGCSYSNNVEIYIDDQLMTSTYATSQWARIKTVIPLGLHTVSIRSNSYSCTIYLDNLVTATAKTNTVLGVQFAGLSNNQLQFVDAGKTVVRSIGAKSPNQNLSVQGIAAVGNEKIVVAFSGNETRLGVLDLGTFNWRYFAGLEPINNYYSSSYNAVVAQGNFAYVATRNALTSAGRISRVNLTSGAIVHFGTHNYGSLALDAAGFIYAYSNGVVYKYDPSSLALLSQMNTINAQQILVDAENRLIVANYNEVVRYNAQRLIDLRLSPSISLRTVAVNARNELIVADQNNQIIWYAADWERSQTLAIPATYLASFPQPDSDTDGIPDWWELANGLDIADATDATADSDSDGLTALAEFAADTDPAVDDTDGDLLNDGDEVNDFKTNPNRLDTDADGLTDAEEVLDHSSNPLLKDSDADMISDLLEITHFLTDPNDAASKPPALVNFVDSFENTVTGWITPALEADAGWTVVTDSVSDGSKSFRSNPIGNNQTAEVEWSAVFNASTLTFDARVSSESCCDHLRVYVDGEEKLYVQTYDQWQNRSLTMTAGFHTIRFVYRKDGSSAAGSDSTWIDNIRVN